MRLIDVETMEITSFAITPDLYKTDILYAILSHTWGEEEVTFQDFYKPGRHLKKGFKKILACCKQANEDGIRWVWVDTCCIDKTNSTELTEAINSMFGWYRLSTVCYVFLEDVPARAPNFPAAKFRKARWFTRGWCLQELLAPPKVEFYAKDWSDIGTKWSLLPLIQEITGIQREALLHERPIWEFSVEERMSWASRRVTTKSEDKAYCLLGIFDVSMPLIYGEGWKAFGRLRRKISKRGHEPPIFSNLRAYKKSIPAGPRLWCHGHHSHQLDPVILKLDFDGRDSFPSQLTSID
ncbi:heterokaryon incompatibility protein-domain-containing protein [Ilyonectria destructans]|nr:heterokaryon incompatibility protein-domain-containing protein [Ilyonectria destructans]